MDMSKLPRLSNTPSPPPDVGEEPAIATTGTSRILDPSSESMLMKMEVWLCIVLGIIFMLLGRDFGIYCLSILFHHPYHTGVNWLEGPLAGQEVAYPDLSGFVIWTDASLFLFGLATFFEGIVLFASDSAARLRRPLLHLAFAITVLAVTFNLLACAKLMTNGVIPIFSLLATAFGIYIAMFEWALLKNTAPAR